jgi:carbamate kinase
MVPSPRPIDILEKDMIMDLIDTHVVIAGGGGGIPTLKTDKGYESVDAVIDKDFTSEKIAELVDADMLMIVTAVPYVAIDFGKETQKDLTDPDIEFIKERLAAGE